MNKLELPLISLLLLALPARAAWLATTTWDVQASSCSDNNGGGFDTASAGIDRSTATSPQVNINNSAVTATVNASVITFTGSTYTVLAGDVGNNVHIITSTGGTAPTAGWYRIISVSAGLNGTWTLDHTTAAVTSTLTSALMGGCLATIGGAMTAQAAATVDMTTYVKTGTYNLTSTITTTTNSSGVFNSRVAGYQTTHGDVPTGTNRPLISTNGNGIVAFTLSAGQGWHLDNLRIDGTAGGGTAGTQGVLITQNHFALFNTKISNFSAECVSLNGSYTAQILASEITGCGGTKGAIYSQSFLQVLWSWVHDNFKTGIYLTDSGQQSQIRWSVISNNTGAATVHGIATLGTTTIENNVIYGNQGDGVHYTQNPSYYESTNMHNIYAKNTGFAINSTVTQGNSKPLTFNYNATWSNNSNSIVQANQYQNFGAGVNDINLSADPFTQDGSNNFTLISTGAGALLRAAGFNALALNGLTGTSYPDIGVLQHQDAAASGSISAIVQ